MPQDNLIKVVDKHQRAVTLCTYNLLFTNDIICCMVVDLVSKVKATPLYKHKTKELLNKVEKARKSYEKKINEVAFDNSSFFADANENFAQALQPHIDVFYYSMKQVFDKENVNGSDIIAFAETARTICEYSCYQFDRRIADMKKLDRSFANVNMEYLKLTELNSLLGKLVGTFTFDQRVDVNTENCTNAMKVLVSKIGDIKLIENAISEGETVI